MAPVILTIDPTSAVALGNLFFPALDACPGHLNWLYGEQSAPTPALEAERADSSPPVPNQSTGRNHLVQFHTLLACCRSLLTLIEKALDLTLQHVYNQGRLNANEHEAYRVSRKGHDIVKPVLWLVELRQQPNQFAFDQFP